MDFGILVDAFKNAALAALVVAFIFGYVVPKATHEDVRRQRDELQGKLDKALETMGEMRSITKEAVDTMKLVVVELQRRSTRSSSGAGSSKGSGGGGSGNGGGGS